ncbi:unnamed protein product [Mytilus coruscus]|uniref:J domain-containing protein n=1 Tax=Mytilus coruscus TaxID=42192 RepID=A0A6J8BPM9_MYTCO|nr:unnamed protein product [Mytilus coruscus]
MLGITKGAIKRDVKMAYRALATKIHPDKNKCDELAGEKFINLTNAYEILYDDMRRKRYEQRNPYFGLEQEEYDWNIPLCSNDEYGTNFTAPDALGQIAFFWETIKNFIPNYTNELLHNFEDSLGMTFRNVLAVFDQEKLAMILYAVCLWLVSQLSTIYESTANFKRDYDHAFPAWFRRFLFAIDTANDMNSLLSLLLHNHKRHRQK